MAGTDVDLSPIAAVLRNIDLTPPKPPSGSVDDDDDDGEDEEKKEERPVETERPQRSPPKWRDWGAMADMAPSRRVLGG